MAAWRLLFSSLKKNGPASTVIPSAVVEEKSISWGRKFVSGALICLTGGLALSAIDDLIIFYGCSSKAMEKAIKNQQVIESIGEPIVRGPWYNASLALARKRHSVSCSFPVSGPLGTGVFQLKAMHNRDDTWFFFLRPYDWDILIMDALLHVPGKEGKEQTFRINIMDSQQFDGKACETCVPQTSITSDRNQPQSE